MGHYRYFDVHLQRPEQHARTSEMNARRDRMCRSGPGMDCRLVSLTCCGEERLPIRAVVRESHVAMALGTGEAVISISTLRGYICELGCISPHSEGSSRQRWALGQRVMRESKAERVSGDNGGWSVSLATTTIAFSSGYQFK